VFAGGATWIDGVKARLASAIIYHALFLTWQSNPLKESNVNLFYLARDYDAATFPCLLAKEG
jgi:hypothetical protein